MRGCIVVPTYNESSNIGRLLDEIIAQGLDADVLVVADNSPDGTAGIVAGRARQNPRIRLMTRMGRRGRGAAGIDAFREAVKMPVDYVVEMDADFSHDPAFLKKFLEPLAGADVVIASRGVAGGDEPGRDCLRKIITRLAWAWIRFWLGVPVADATSGYRCFRRGILEKIDWDKMVSIGPSIVEEILWAAHRAGARIVEIPFVFLPRAAGSSQLTARKLLQTLRLTALFRFKTPPLAAASQK